eukprot:2675675-Pleurochrysis_carterae.AAC.2
MQAGVRLRHFLSETNILDLTRAHSLHLDRRRFHSLGGCGFSALSQRRAQRRRCEVCALRLPALAAVTDLVAAGPGVPSNEAKISAAVGEMLDARKYAHRLSFLNTAWMSFKSLASGEENGLPSS